MFACACFLLYILGVFLFALSVYLGMRRCSVCDINALLFPGEAGYSSPDVLTDVFFEYEFSVFLFLLFVFMFLSGMRTPEVPASYCFSSRTNRLVCFAKRPGERQYTCRETAGMQRSSCSHVLLSGLVLPRQRGMDTAEVCMTKNTCTFCLCVMRQTD